ncbi:DNA translocase FtsK [hydrothermal vent metagenome]|uniref:DNA translocase FtsK n=1 Tax=hydrothermal vent metagenome TaxID=652676 RepID=A0A3B1CXD9_9ZZZZ
MQSQLLVHQLIIENVCDKFETFEELLKSVAIRARHLIPKVTDKTYIDEVVGIAFILFALLIAVSLASYSPADPSFSTVTSNIEVQNAVGKIGAGFAEFFVQIFGVSSYLLPVFFLIIGVTQIRVKPAARNNASLITGFALMAISLATLRQIVWKSPVETTLLIAEPYNNGGMIGEIVAGFFLHYFALTGAYIIFSSLLLIGAMLAFPFSPTRSLKQGLGILRALKTGGLRAWRGHKEKKDAFEGEGALSPAQQVVAELEEAPRVNRQPEIASAPPQIATKPKQEIFDFDQEDIGDYRLPPLTLLSDPPLMTGGMSQKELIAQSHILQKKLRDFGVEGRVTQVHPGPVITMFEFAPAAGVKLNKITSLSDDLALGMRALSVRIVAPLPGKPTVGIEIPNPKREAVFLKEVLSSPAHNRISSILKLALGKDIFGNPFSTDLSKMPHLLIAGATGSGKSVGLNSMVLSILFSSTPAEVKMLMIDPKMLEFTLYDGIPHLITPVIVRPKAASAALKKMVAEMQRRYELLSEKSVRNIESYNKLAAQSEDMDLLPYIVVFIDELADLMMVASKDVEDSIARLAQMARAAGIHLVLATQRPSVDVLTGLIKANFPARIAFNVSSKTDSRTILDANGAEKLLGKGDMLYLSAGTGKLTRVHGAYIAEDEVKKVVTFIKEQSQPYYESAFSEGESSEKEYSDETSDDRDDRYEDARELVISTRQASASFLQRRMRVGYPRAARMIEMMEEDGLIGPAVGSKPREVFVRKEEGDHV